MGQADGTVTKPCPACKSDMPVHATGSNYCLNRQILKLRLTEHDLRQELAAAKDGLERYRIMYQSDTAHLQEQVDKLSEIIPKVERKRK